MNHRRAKGIAGLSVLTVAVVVTAAGCGMKKRPASLASAVPDDTSISVSVDTLWSEEAKQDPVAAYKIRLAADPHNASLHNNLGNAYVLRNMMEEALVEFRTAADLNPRSPIPWNNIGTVHRETGDIRAVRAAFRRAIRLDPDYALAYYNLGTTYDDKGNYDKALEFYLEAVSLQPNLLDSTLNPQAVGNKHLMVIQLRHFLEESGNIALPLDRLPE